MEVAYGGVAHTVEGSDVLLTEGHGIEGQRMAVAVEGAAIGVAIGAHHRQCLAQVYIGGHHCVKIVTPAIH